MNTILDYQFIYCANPFDDEPIMDINQSIGINPATGEGISGTIFAKEITMLDSMNKKRINIYINSQGGSVTEGYTIFTSIYRCKTETCGYVGGAAASTAGWILQACSYRCMFSFSHYMVHNPAFKGDDTTVEEDPFLELIKNGLLDMLKTKKLSDKSLNKMMNDETYMSADEALTYGFIDEILDINEEVGDKNTSYIINDSSKLIQNRTEIKNIVEQYSLLENEVKSNIKNKKIINTMDLKIEKLKKMLNLSDTATEAEIINSAKNEYPWMFKFAEQIFNTEEPKTEAVKGKTGVKNASKDEDELEEDCMNDDDMMMDNSDDESVIDSADGIKKNPNIDNKLRKEIANLKKEISTLKNIKATELINSAVKDGKLSEIEGKVWLNLAKKDYDSTATALQTFKVNKKSEPIINAADKIILDEKLKDIKKEAVNEVKEEIKETINVEKSWDKIDMNSLFGKKYEKLS